MVKDRDALAAEPVGEVRSRNIGAYYAARKVGALITDRADPRDVAPPEPEPKAKAKPSSKKG